MDRGHPDLRGKLPYLQGGMESRRVVRVEGGDVPGVSCTPERRFIGDPDVSHFLQKNEYSHSHPLTSLTYVSLHLTPKPPCG